MTYHIYFIHAPDIKAIKIGLSNNIKRALREVELNSPCPVQLLGSLPESTKKDLVKLQAQYKKLHHDWFEEDPRLLNLASTVTFQEKISTVYKDISYLCYKYSISRRKLNRILNWIESSKKINLAGPPWSTVAPAGHDNDTMWFNWHFTDEAIVLIEIGIVNYSKKHPQSRIVLDRKFQAVVGWE